MTIRIRFSEIERSVPVRPGIYEIHTDNGLPLKVGVGGDIRKRLLQHRESRQDRLKLREGGDRSNPNDVSSKQSILAKHLYYDRSVTTEYDLTSEFGRRAFLLEKCYITFDVTATRADALKLEKERERLGCFRYVGRVVIR